MFKRDLKELRIWVQSMALAKVIYSVTATLPKEEIFGLKSQMRRAAVSIPSNIAEGSQRSTDRDFAHFILIAKGSLAELQTQILLAHEIGYYTKDQISDALINIESIHKQLHVFHSKLIARSS